MDVLAKVKSFDINMGWCSSITKMRREEKKKKLKCQGLTVRIK